MVTCRFRRLDAKPMRVLPNRRTFIKKLSTDDSYQSLGIGTPSIFHNGWVAAQDVPAFTAESFPHDHQISALDRQIHTLSSHRRYQAPATVIILTTKP